MSDSVTLLPPNATELEKALARCAARVSSLGVTAKMLALWNPATCPAATLPWLAQALHVDEWSDIWTEAQKRAVIAASVATHKRKGTIGALKRALTALGYDVIVDEDTGIQFTFRLAFNLNQTGPLTGDTYAAARRVALANKNARSHLLAVRSTLTGEAGLHIGVAHYRAQTVTADCADVPPMIVESSDGGSYMMGDSITLEVLAIGTELTYQWYLSESPISGATTATYTFVAAVETLGDYTCRLTAAGETEITPTISITQKMITSSLFATMSLVVTSIASGPSDTLLMATSVVGSHGSDRIAQVSVTDGTVVSQGLIPYVHSMLVASDGYLYAVQHTDSGTGDALIKIDLTDWSYSTVASGYNLQGGRGIIEVSGTLYYGGLNKVHSYVLATGATNYGTGYGATLTDTGTELIYVYYGRIYAMPYDLSANTIRYDSGYGSLSGGIINNSTAWIWQSTSTTNSVVVSLSDYSATSTDSSMVAVAGSATFILDDTMFSVSNVATTYVEASVFQLMGTHVEQVASLSGSLKCAYTRNNNTYISMGTSVYRLTFE